MMIGAVVATDRLRIGGMAGFTAAIANGTSVAVTGSVTTFIVGGYPPYSYDWTDNAGGVSVQASTSVNARLQATGTNTEHNVQVILRLTEANGVITTASANVIITQGTP